MRSYLFLITAFLLIITTGPANSAVSPVRIISEQATSITSIPYKLQWIASAPGVAANSAQFVTRAVAYTPAVAGALTRSFMLSPGGIALTAAMVAAGYIWDSNTGTLTEGSQTITGDAYVCTYTFGGVTSTPYVTTPQDCVPLVEATFGGYVTPDGAWRIDTPCFYTPGIGIQCPVVNNVTNAWANDTTYGIISGPFSDVTYETGGAVIDDLALADLVESTYPEFIPNIFTDPVTGVPTITPELTDVMNDVEADFNARYDSDPVTVPSTNPATNDDGLDTQTDALTDCDFFPTLCTWLDWFREGEDLTLDETPPPNIQQTVDANSVADFTGSPISIGGSASCPAPYTLSVFTHSLEMDYTPFCTLSTYLNPLILAMATMTGIFYFVRIVSV